MSSTNSNVVSFAAERLKRRPWEPKLAAKELLKRRKRSKEARYAADVAYVREMLQGCSDMSRAMYNIVQHLRDGSNLLSEDWGRK